MAICGRRECAGDGFLRIRIEGPAAFKATHIERPVVLIIHIEEQSVPRLKQHFIVVQVVGVAEVAAVTWLMLMFVMSHLPRQ